MAKEESLEIPTFQDWTNRIKVYGDYIRALAEYKKAAAEEALKTAQAAQIWSQVRAMQIVIRQMTLELQRLNRATSTVQKEAKRIMDLGKRASLLLSGRRLQALSQAWSAYQQFERQALIESTEDLAAMPLAGNSHDARHYFDNRAPDRPCKPPPDEIDTAIGLAAWLQGVRYLPRSGSPPHRSLVNLFRAINTVAANEVKEMTSALDAMRKGTYDAWKPPTIIGISPKVRRLAIEGTFNSRGSRIRSVPLPPRVVQSLKSQ